MGKRLMRKPLIDEATIEKKKIDFLLAGLSDEEMTTGGVTPGGWSVKDLLGHLIGWQQLILSFYYAEEQGETPSVPGYGLTWRQTPELNRIIYKQYRDKSLSEVRNLFEKSHLAMLELVESLSDDDLIGVGRFKWAGPSWCISDYVRAETTAHYRWAAKHINRWLRQKIEVNKYAA